MKNIFMLFTVLAVVVSLQPNSVQAQESNVELEQFDFANGLFERGMYDMAYTEYVKYLAQYQTTAPFSSEIIHYAGKSLKYAATF